MDQLCRETDVPSILNEWYTKGDWRIVKDRDGNLVFMRDSSGRLGSDMETLTTFLHDVLNWSGLADRIEEAGPANVTRLLGALYVLVCCAGKEKEE